MSEEVHFQSGDNNVTTEASTFLHKFQFQDAFNFAAYLSMSLGLSGLSQVTMKDRVTLFFSNDDD